MEYVVSIDIGGTSTRVALVDQEFNIIQREVFDTQQDPDDNISMINNVIKSFNKPIRGIGVSCPGPLDLKEGIVLTPPNLSSWHFYPLVSKLSKLTGIPTILENDANLAALAEAKLGEGKGKDIIQYFTISTGIGGGLVIDGKIYQGSKGFAQEVANVILEPNGFQLGELQPGSLESLCSGTAITTRAKLAQLEVDHAGDVITLANSGNKKAEEIINNAINYLSNTMAACYGFLDPDIIILGGGVINKTPGLVEKIESLTKEKVYPIIKDNIVIRKTILGDDNGILGGALLAFDLA